MEKQSKQQYSGLFLIISMIFVASLIISNTIATKIIMVGSLSVAAGIICFPISYIISDIVTEVYGYRRAKVMIWTGFACLAFMSVAYALAAWLAPAPFFANETAFDTIFSQVPRIALGSLAGYLVGSFINSIVMSKMKIWTNGKHLWSRTIGSTILGEGADSIVFAVVAFAGLFPTAQLAMIAFSGFLLKTLYEIAATPVTYAIVRKVKQIEGTDAFDNGQSYSPFT
jgi:queuosine precursor transporter